MANLFDDFMVGLKDANVSGKTETQPKGKTSSNLFDDFIADINYEPEQLPSSFQIENVIQPQEIKAPEENTFARLGKSFLSGYVSPVEGTARSLEKFVPRIAPWTEFTSKPIFKFAADKAKVAREYYTPKQPKFPDMLASGFGSMAAFLIPGMGFSKVSAAPSLAKWFGASAAAVNESLTEAGLTYQSAIDKGMTEKQAVGAATKDFFLNLPIIVFTNKMGVFGDKGGIVRRIIASAPVEAVQEFSQQLISNWAVKDPVLQGAMESALVGGIVGGITGGGVAALERGTQPPGITQAKGKTPPTASPAVTQQPVAPVTPLQPEQVIKPQEIQAPGAMPEGLVTNVQEPAPQGIEIAAPAEQTQIGGIEEAEPITVKPRKQQKFDIGKAVRRRDYRTLLRAGNIQLPDILQKNFELEEIKKIKFLFRRGGIRLDKYVQQLQAQYPELQIVDDVDFLRKAIEQTGKTLVEIEGLEKKLDAGIQKRMEEYGPSDEEMKGIVQEADAKADKGDTYEEINAGQEEAIGGIIKEAQEALTLEGLPEGAIEEVALPPPPPTDPQQALEERCYAIYEAYIAPLHTVDPAKANTKEFKKAKEKAFFRALSKIRQEMGLSNSEEDTDMAMEMLEGMDKKWKSNNGILPEGLEESQTYLPGVELTKPTGNPTEDELRPNDESPVVKEGTIQDLMDRGELDKNSIYDLIVAEAEKNRRIIYDISLVKHETFKSMLDTIVNSTYKALGNMTYKGKELLPQSVHYAMRNVMNESRIDIDFNKKGLRGLNIKVAKVQQAKKELIQNLEREPTVEEIAEKVKLRKNKSENLDEVRSVLNYIEINKPANYNDIMQQLEGGTYETTEEYVDRTWSEDIEKEKNNPEIQMNTLVLAPPVAMGQSIANDFNMVVQNFKKFINALRFYPQLKEFPELINDIRVKFLGGRIDAQHFCDKVYQVVFGKLKFNDLKTAVNIIFLRSQLRRIKNGQELNVSEQEAEKLLQDEMTKSNPKVMEAIDRWKKVTDKLFAELVVRGKLGPEDYMEDYVNFRVKDLTKDWHLYNSLPKRLKRPFRPYTEKAKGSTKPYLADLNVIMHYVYQVKMDNLIDDFMFEQLQKYDISSKMSEADQIKYFGTQLAFGKYVIPRSPQPKMAYTIDGKRYVGWQYERFPRHLFKTDEGLLALGKWQKVYLIPETIGDLFDNFKQSNDEVISGAIAIANRLTSLFKGSAIFAVYGRYNFNNFIGDGSSLFYQYPRGLKKTAQAIKFLSKKAQNYTPFEKAFSAFVNKHRVLEAFTTTELRHLNFTENAYENATKLLRKANDFRERILRCSLAMSLFEDLQNGINRSEEIDWIPTEGLDEETAIGKIAREMVIDYIAVSQGFSRYIRGLLLPFGTWPIKQTALLMRFAAKHPFRSALTMAAPGLVFAALNNMTPDRRKIEQALPSYVRNRTHLIFPWGTKHPNRQWVFLPQLPTDVLPAFPLINIAIRYAYDASIGKISVEDAVKRTIADTFGTTKKNLTMLTAPWMRFMWGFISNKDPLTKREIVPRDAKVDAMLATKYYSLFAMECLVPPIALALRAERDTGYDADVPFWSSTAKWAYEWLDPVKMLGFYNVELTGREDTIARAQFDALKKYNSLMVRVGEDFSQDKLKPKEFYIQLAVKRGLVTNPDEAAKLSMSMDNILKNPLYVIANYESKLKKTDDEKERMMLEAKIQGQKAYRRFNLFKTQPVPARGLTKREMDRWLGEADVEGKYKPINIAAPRQ